MFRQTGNSDPGPSGTGELLVTGGGSGPGSEVTIVGPLGQEPMADSIPVVIASDQSPVPVEVSNSSGTTLNKHLAPDTYTDEPVVADPGDGFRVVITNIVASKGVAEAGDFFLEEGSTSVFGPIYLEAIAGRGFASGPITKKITASTGVTVTTSVDMALDFDYFIEAV